MTEIIRIPTNLLTQEETDKIAEMLTEKINEFDDAKRICLEDQVEKLERTG